MMKWLILFPFFLQAAAILIDEFYFHRSRGLPKWERIGHPLDTLSLLMCMGVVLFIPFSMQALKIYGMFAVFSCLMVTKDEFIHKHHCPWAENWLHAILFILHPLTLACTMLLWPVIQNVAEFPWNYAWLNEPLLYRSFLYLQTVMITVFFIYQVVFWNFIWNNKPVIRH